MSQYDYREARERADGSNSFVEPNPFGVHRNPASGVLLRKFGALIAVVVERRRDPNICLKLPLCGFSSEVQSDVEGMSDLDLVNIRHEVAPRTVEHMSKWAAIGARSKALGHDGLDGCTSASVGTVITHGWISSETRDETGHSLGLVRFACLYSRTPVRSFTSLRKSFVI
jgi:hypothetical protein